MKALRVLKRILVTIVYTVLALSVISTGWKLYQSKVKGNPFPMAFWHTYSIVLSGSMDPAIAVDDVVVCTNIGLDKIAVGDIVVYDDEEYAYPIVHRIVEIDDINGLITTKGDANTLQDPPIKDTQILAKYVCKLSGFGKYVEFIKSPLGLISAAAFIALLIVIDTVYKRKKEHHERIKKATEKQREREAEKARSGENILVKNKKKYKSDDSDCDDYYDGYILPEHDE